MMPFGLLLGAVIALITTLVVVEFPPPDFFAWLLIGAAYLTAIITMVYTLLKMEEETQT